MVDDKNDRLLRILCHFEEPLRVGLNTGSRIDEYNREIGGGQRRFRFTAIVGETGRVEYINLVMELFFTDRS